MSSTLNSNIVQGPGSSHNINSLPKIAADHPLSRGDKRKARIFARMVEADLINASIAMMTASEAFARSINEWVARLAVLQGPPSFHVFRRVEGGKGGSFIPLRFEADGSVVYRRARHTRALALFTATERRKFVKTVKAYPAVAAQGRAVRRARELFAREMRAAARRDREALS
jgi:hypothetical protein